MIRRENASPPSDSQSENPIVDNVVTAFVATLLLRTVASSPYVPSWIILPRILSLSDTIYTAILVSILRRNEGLVVTIMPTIETKTIEITIPAPLARSKTTVDPIGKIAVVEAGIRTSDVSTTISKA